MHKYEDIIHLPHHVSEKRLPMSMVNRGAQFSPFAALTGYDAAIQESARLTDQPVELSDGEKELLNEKLQQILDKQGERPEAAVTYFRPDERKCGGAYITVADVVRKIDVYRKQLVMEGGVIIPFSNIYEIRLIDQEHQRKLDGIY